MSALRADFWPVASVSHDDHCDLCGERRQLDADAYEASGLWICTHCIEAMLDAQPYDARAEVGLVGGGH